MDREDRAAVARQRPQRGEQIRRRGEIRVREGFVEEEELGVGGKRARDQYALLLSAREFADLGVGLRSKTDRFECADRGIAAGAARTAEYAEPRGETHGRHVKRARGEVPVDLGALRHERDAGARGGKRLPEESHVARRCDREQPEDSLEKRALPRAVRADERGHGASFERERCIAHDVGIARAIAARESADRERRGVQRRPPSPAAIARALCRSMPAHVAPSEAAGPRESE